MSKKLMSNTSLRAIDYARLIEASKHFYAPDTVFVCKRAKGQCTEIEMQYPNADPFGLYSSAGELICVHYGTYATALEYAEEIGYTPQGAQ